IHRGVGPRGGPDVQEPSLRIERTALPVHAARTRECQSAFGAFCWIDDGWRRVHRPQSKTLYRIKRHLLELRREVDEIAFAHPLSVHRGRLGREWLRRGSLLTWRVGLRNRPFFDRPDRLAVGPIEDEGKRLLRQLHDRLDRSAVNGDVCQDRGGGHVVVPDVVMSQLVGPDAFAGFDVEAHDRRGEEVVSPALSAVLVTCLAFDRYIHVPELFVDRERSPSSGVPRIDVRPILPSVFAELALAWNGMEAPQLLAGPNVEGHHV